MQEQIDLFSYVLPKFKITKPIRLIELFAGIGSQAKALQNLGAEFEHHFVCEIDKYALASYNAIFNTSFETKDIKKVSASELKITEREILLHTYLFFSLSRFKPSRSWKRYGKRHRHKKWIVMGSRKNIR